MAGPWRWALPAPSASVAKSLCFVALQPIFTHRESVFGYEALFRSGWKNKFSGNPTAATRTVVKDWIPHGFHNLIGRSRVFLNCTREALLGGSLTQLSTLTVIELLETVSADKEVLEACRKMKALGYQIALDSFQLSPKKNALIELADYVKVDFQVSRAEQRKRILGCLKKEAIIPVAEKIETKEELEVARGEGFGLFQGHYLESPRVYSKRRAGGR